MPRNRTAALFLFFWAAIGATTNVQNMRAYNLQQMGVDAIVAHRTFSLGHSALSILQPQGDTFVYDGRILAARADSSCSALSLTFFCTPRVSPTSATTISRHPW